MAAADIGIMGSGVMGSNLALNIADKKSSTGSNFSVALFDLVPAQVEQVLKDNASYDNLLGFKGAEALGDFVASLKKPRKIIMLVPAGKMTDDAIEQVAPMLESNDILIDVGNANFRDQIRRAESLEAKGLRFLNMGVSGGAEGARKGPAFFPGGTMSIWEDIREIVEAAAAKAEDGKPCVTMNGNSGAGSCVKMFHNAGEYAVLQIWGEVFEIMKAYGVPPERQKALLTEWKTKRGGRFDGLLDSYMLDITIEVVAVLDSHDAGGVADNNLLIDRCMDRTDSKGTGLWSIVEALNAGEPAPSLVAAVLARQMSMQRKQRLQNAEAARLPSPPESTAGKWTTEMEDNLYWAAALSIIASYAQMFQCLRKMDELFQFGMNLPKTIATFRAGCILQGFLLQPMTEAFETDGNCNLITAFAEELKIGLPQCKLMLGAATMQTVATIPCMYASLDYVQTMLCTEIPSAQCVSLQRDVFGRHGYERLDKDGRFYASWKPMHPGGAKVSSAKSGPAA